MDEKLRAADLRTRIEAVKFDLKLRRRVTRFKASSEKNPNSGSRIGIVASLSESNISG